MNKQQPLNLKRISSSAELDRQQSVLVPEYIRIAQRPSIGEPVGPYLQPYRTLVNPIAGVAACRSNGVGDLKTHPFAQEEETLKR